MTDRRAPPEPLQSRQPSFERLFDHHPREHGRPETGALPLADAGLALIDRRWRAPLRLGAPLAGCGPAWLAHFRVERNPSRSLRADLRTLRPWPTGRLEERLRQAGVR